MYLRALLIGAVALSACGKDACGDAEASEAASAPRITALRMLDNPVPGDPWELVFVADFTDSDGDLGDGGTAEVFLNGGEPTSLGLRDSFRQGGIPFDATGGGIQLALRFTETVPDDSDVTMGVQVVDLAEQRSNCFSLDLHFDVQQAATLLEGWWSQGRLALARLMERRGHDRA